MEVLGLAAVELCIDRCEWLVAGLEETIRVSSCTEIWRRISLGIQQQWFRRNEDIKQQCEPLRAA